MDEAERLCDRVAIVDHGKVIALGTPAELIARLGGDHVVECTLSGDGQLDPATLAGLDAIRSATQENGLYRLTVGELHVALPALLARLRQEGQQLADLKTHHASLEDVFVSLTGRLLDDEGKSSS
jgi:ABC-2 type transport system ATP-binding protein